MSKRTRHNWKRCPEKDDAGHFVLRCTNCKHWTAISTTEPDLTGVLYDVHMDHEWCHYPVLGGGHPYDADKPNAHDNDDPSAIVVLIDKTRQVYRTRMPDGTEREHSFA